MALVFLSTAAIPAQENHSSLVYPDDDGKLVYVPDEQGNVIPDYSYAGYMGGGVALPDVPVKITLEPVEGDNAPQIQLAIDQIADMKIDEHGFRGAVLLKKGIYHMHKPLWIISSGIVLRGEGNGPEGTVLTGYGKHDNKSSQAARSSSIIEIRGMDGAEEMYGTASRITDPYVSVGTRTFSIENSGELKSGDTVIVRKFANEDWIREVGMINPKTGELRDHGPLDMERTITNVKGNRITVDIPIVAPIETRWGGGEIIKYTDNKRITNVGIENMRGVSDFDPSLKTTRIYQTVPESGPEYFRDENHYSNFISMRNAKNCWVRDITVRHFIHALAEMRNGAKWITVRDCDAREFVSVLMGGRRAPYNIMQGQLCLVMRCTSDDGRHDFVTGGIAGPSVFLDCTAGTSYSSSEPHGAWAYGVLYDNVAAPITVRYTKRTTPVWCGGFCCLWNCEGMFLVQKPPTAQNWVIGQIGKYEMIHNIPLVDLTKPPGFIESRGKHVTPRSLYLTQLKERLGEQALRNTGY
jgi:hypothetical protein